MNPKQHPCQQTYALRLRAPGGEPTAVVGQLEHVLSGECRDFTSGADLLAALAQLQAGVAPAATQRPGSPAPRR